MTLSTHKVEIVRVDKLDPILGADFIGVATVWGYTCVVRKEDFEANKNKLWAYCAPDALVPVDRPEFKFLDKGNVENRYERIRVRKYKGQKSFGLLVTAPAGAKEGEDWAERLGVLHYEPPVKEEPQPRGGFKRRLLRRIFRNTSLYGEKNPKNIHAPYYDIEALRRYPDLFVEGETVVVTEKVHGCNVCFGWEDRGLVWRLFNLSRPWYARYLRVRSRTVWKKPFGNVWADAVPQGVIDYLKANPTHIIFGEIYGPSVQKLTYGVPKPTFVLFDILVPDAGWQEYTNSYGLQGICLAYNIPLVPMLYSGSYSFDTMQELAEGMTVLGNGAHLREGIVVKAEPNRRDPTLGRAQLKMVGFGYLDKDSAAEGKWTERRKELHKEWVQNRGQERV